VSIEGRRMTLRERYTRSRPSNPALRSDQKTCVPAIVGSGTAASILARHSPSLLYDTRSHDPAPVPIHGIYGIWDSNIGMR
jgi:hypothetical protein